MLTSTHRTGLFLCLASYYVTWVFYILAKLTGYLSSAYMIIGFAVVADSGATKDLSSRFGFVGAAYGGKIIASLS